MTRVDILRCLLLALRGHFRRVGGAGHAARAKLLALDIILSGTILLTIVGHEGGSLPQRWREATVPGVRIVITRQPTQSHALRHRCQSSSGAPDVRRTLSARKS